MPASAQAHVREVEAGHGRTKAIVISFVLFRITIVVTDTGEAQ